MSDYIDREAAIKAMLTRFWDGKETLREIMNSVPAADVELVKRGTWLDVEESDLVGEPIYDVYYCSCCKRAKTMTPLYPRCHVCGAIMSNATVSEDFVI